MSLRQIAHSVWLNPGNRHALLRRSLTAVAWQLYKRTIRKPRIITLANQARMFAYCDSVVSSSLIYAEWPEYHELQFIRKILSEHDVVIDVGANIGHISLLVADIVGPESLVCFEPTPISYNRLVENFQLNDWPTTNLHHAAIGATKGTVKIPDVPYPLTTNKTVEGGQSENIVDVPLLRLDDFCDSFPNRSVGLLKIDVEGYERPVFDGARRFLADRKPKLVLFESLSGSLDESIGTILSETDYKLFELDPEGRPTTDDLGAQNLFATPEENWKAILSLH